MVQPVQPYPIRDSKGNLWEFYPELWQREPKLTRPAPTLEEEIRKLVDDALEMVSEKGTIEAMKWLGSAAYYKGKRNKP